MICKTRLTLILSLAILLIGSVSFSDSASASIKMACGQPESRSCDSALIAVRGPARATKAEFCIVITCRFADGSKYGWSTYVDPPFTLYVGRKYRVILRFWVGNRISTTKTTGIVIPAREG